MSKFQSFLIFGKSDSQQKTLTALLKNYEADLKITSPDIITAQPQKNSIQIDQIREIKSLIWQKPVQLEKRIIIVWDFDKATIEAQNSTLKILEEPPKHAIIILLAQNKHLILPTIISRVVTIKSEEKSALSEELLITKGQEDALLQIASIENAQEFLDSQIVALTELLVKGIRENRHASHIKIRQFIEKCKEAKEMIGANVNPKFVLANLVFAIAKPASE